MPQSNAVLAVKELAGDIVGSFLYLPIWWYTKGMVRTGAYCVRTVRGSAEQFGIGVWIKNLFVPMFGQHDIAGRIISFFMRLVIIFWYSVVLVVETALMSALFVLWLAFPLFVARELYFQLAGGLNLVTP